MTKKSKKKKNAAAWKKTANMTPAQKRSYHAALRKVKRQDEKEAAQKAAAKKAAEAAAAKETPAGFVPQAEKTGIRGLLFYWLIFFAAIVYWEVYLGILAQGSILSLNWWFLLFALPVSLLLAALCGWWKDKADRMIAAVLMLLPFAFYVSQFIYFRVFGSMISMSMIGVGGDALANFGWAMMVTIKESIHLLILFALPVLLMIAWIFIRKPAAPSYRMWLRPAALLCVVPLWLLAGAALRLGGTGEPSAYNAYHSALTDTDTASRKIGVMTTSFMELRSTSASEQYDAEIADTFSTVAAGDDLNISLGATGPVLLPESENITEIKAGAESVDAPKQPEELEAAPELLKPVPNRLEEIDFEYLSSLAKDEAVKTLCDYYAGVSPTNKNDYTGMLEDYNLICVCAESFCSYAINEKLTPTLYKLANEGIVLTNFYNSFKNTTTNGEFSFMTGLWPDVSRKADKGVTDGSFGQSVKHYMPYGLGHMFEDLGVKSYAFHNYYGEYYGRAKTHKNLGFKCKFMGEMKFSNKWPSSDLEMMKQSVDDFINEDRFNVYYMTFSGHGPYDKDKNAITKHNLSKVPKKLDGRELNYGARCYLANNLELEYAMKYLMDRLEQADKLDNTLIVLVGDHYPYYLTDKAAKSLVGYLPDTDFERYHSTCTMWFNGLAEPIVCDTPCCNVDILPTILNLMNIEYDSRLISGTDIFSDSLHAAMLYNKNFITDKVKYNAADGKAEWLIDTEGIPEADLQAYVDNVYSILKGRYAAALSINNLDFYRFVWDNLLLPEIETTGASEAVPIASTASSDTTASDANLLEETSAGPMINIDEGTKTFYTTRAGRE